MARQLYRVHENITTEPVEIDSRELLSFQQVAVTLGVSSATLRRMIKNGDFPETVVYSLNGKKHFWTKILVLHWQKSRITRGIAPTKKARFRSPDQVDVALAKMDSVKDIIRQAEDGRVMRIGILFDQDPDGLIEAHPALKKWVRQKLPRQPR